MEYPFKDLLPLDEVLEREGYYKDWTHLDPKTFYSIVQISEMIKTKGFGTDVRLLISQLAEHFGLSVVEVTDIANGLIARQSSVEDRQDAVEQYNDQVIQEMTDKDVISAPEIIEAREGKATLSERLDDDFGAITSELSQAVLDLLDVSDDVATLDRYVSDNWVDIRHFGAVADANYYNSKNDTWYKNGTYTGFLGSNPEGLDVENLYYNPDNYNYYTDATFSEPATDNASAIQSAIDFVSQSSTVKRIYTPNGRFFINQRLTISKSNIMFTGNGPTSEWIAGSGVDQYLIYSHNDDRDYNNKNLMNIVFQDFCINGNGKDLTGIWVRQMTRGCVIERMKVHNFKDNQIQLEYSWSFSIMNNVFNGVRTHDGTTWVYHGGGLLLGWNGTVNIPTIIGNTFQFLDFGIDWRYGIGGTLNGNDFENCETRWLRILGVKGASVTGNYFEDMRTGTYGVQLGWVNVDNNANSIVFMGNMFNPKKSGQVAIIIRHLANSKITNNYYGSTTEGNDVAIQTTPPLEDAWTYANEISYRKGEIFGLSNINTELNEMIELVNSIV